MNVGLISPIPHLEEFGRGSFHLILAHIADQDRYYYRHYVEEAQRGAYVVLDNSAHEHGAGGKPEDLLDLGLKMGVSELVCPDVLDSYEGTIENTYKALEYFKANQDDLDNFQIRLMMVPQAESTYKWGKCLQDLIREHIRHFGARPFTIGISKDYEIWEGGLGHLIQTYVEPAWRQYKMDVHLLGWGRNLSELSSLSARFPWIRSTDSAKPFVYGMNEILLRMGENPEYPRRPPDYFEREMTELQLDIARHNVNVFRIRARWKEQDAYNLQRVS